MKINKLKELFIEACYLVIFLCSDISCMEENELYEQTGKYSSMCQKPQGPEEWKDQSGNYAPVSVREAADRLWESVELEGKAAFDDGYGFRTAAPCQQRCCVAFLSCGMSECGRMWEVTNRFERCIMGQRIRRDGVIDFGVSYIQRTEEVMKVLASFKDAVNQAVAKPELYSGDFNISLEEWVKDGKWEGYRFISGRRNMSHVTQSTRDFVNSHGGWLVSSNQTYKDPSILKDM